MHAGKFLRSPAGCRTAAVAPPEAFGHNTPQLFGNALGSEPGWKLCGPASGFRFLGFGINHAAGYARVDLGGWYAINSRITAYANVENALNDHYNEVVGYPALTANFRAGVRFRIGGEKAGCGKSQILV